MNVPMELIEHTRFTKLSTRHGACSVRTTTPCGTILRNEENPYCLPRRRRWTQKRRSSITDGHCPTATRLGSGTGPVSRCYGPFGCSAQVHGDPDTAAVQHSSPKWLDFRQRLSSSYSASYDSTLSQAACALAQRLLAREASRSPRFRNPSFQPRDLR